MTEIWQYVRVISRWWWLMLLGTVLTTGLGWGYANTLPPVYVASASLLVQAGGSADDYGSVMASEKMAETYKALLTKRPVLQEAAQALGLDVEDVARQVKTHLVTKTLIIELSVEDHNPYMAAALANQIVEAFMRSVRDSVKARPRDVTVVELATPPLKPSSPNRVRLIAIAGMAGLVLFGGFAFGVEYLRSPLEHASDVHRYLGLATLAVIPRARRRPSRSAHGQSAQVSGERRQAATSRVPDSPYSVRLARWPSVRRALSHLRGKRPPLGARSREPVVLCAPDSAVADAYRTLRTWLQFSHREQPLPSLLLTSPSSRKTKGAVAANLGIVLAQAGLRVMVIDADLREPGLHGLLGVRGGPGLSELLAAAGDWRSFTAKTAVAGLELIPAGLLVQSALESPDSTSNRDALSLLSSARMPWLLRQLESRYDVVLVHGPPALGTADAFVLAAQVSATVLVIESRSTLYKRAVQALALLRNAQAMVLGAILTQARKSAVGAYADVYLASMAASPEAEPERRSSVELPSESRSGREPYTGDYSRDYAALYVRPGQRALLPRGMPDVYRGPAPGASAGPGMDEPGYDESGGDDADIDLERRREPGEFIEGHLVTLADLFAEPSKPAD